RLRKKGIEPGSTGALDRLAFTGRQGMGALSYEPDKSDGEIHEVIDLETIKNEIDDLKKLGLSSGLKQSLIDATLDKISYCAAQWEMYCDKSEIPKEIKERVQSRFILK
nr:hypothetical protein [Bacteroidales bacterium]